MRLSIERSAPVSPPEAAKELSGGLSNVTYHFGVLAEVEALVVTDTRSGPDVNQRFYSPNPTVVGAPAVKELLAASSQASS